MKIALFGASGQTGREFLSLALGAGHKVKALVRNPGAWSVNHPNLAVVAGDVLNRSDVEKTVEATEIVVSLFGHVKNSPEWLQTNGTKNIVEAMKRHGVPRIISLSGGGLPYPDQDKPKLADKMIRTILKMVAPKILNDAIEHHRVLSQSGLKWVIVRGPRLTNEPAKGTYRVGWVGVNASTKVGRADLAHFILTQLTDQRFNYQMPFVSY